MGHVSFREGRCLRAKQLVAVSTIRSLFFQEFHPTTLPETNHVVPENGWLDEISYWVSAYFSGAGAMLISPRVMGWVTRN